MTGQEGALSGQDGSQADMMQERCILVDSSDNVIGSETKLKCHYGDGLLHRAFSVLLFKGGGQYLLVQKRSADKITFLQSGQIPAAATLSISPVRMRMQSVE